MSCNSCQFSSEISKGKKYFISGSMNFISSSYTGTPSFSEIVCPFLFFPRELSCIWYLVLPLTTIILYLCQIETLLY